MIEQQQGQFTLYATETAIPRYQRAWVWGSAAFIILLCGLLSGWLLGGIKDNFWDNWSSVPIRATDNQTLLAQQQATNEALRNRIAQLEQAMRDDVCNPR